MLWVAFAVSEHWLRAAVPRERPEAAAPQTARCFRVAGFARFNAAVVEGGLCGNWLGGAMRSDRIELANKPERVSVAKAALSRADATRHGGEQEPQDCCAFRANRSQPE